MPLAHIVGHTRTIELLRRAVSRDAVPQSLLFAGPEGVGKRAVALALAQAVNCPQRKDGDACGTCPVCRRIAAGTFFDVVVLDKGDQASIRIDPLREKVLGVIGYRPFEGAKRVFIIDPADELIIQAQDALLKTLEEPPSSALIVLVTAYPDTLLATIRSRCRRLRFGALSDEEVGRVLTTGAEAMSPAEARRRASVAGGSVSRALAVDAGEFDDDRAVAFNLLAAAQGAGVAGRLKASAAFAQVEKRRRAREAAASRLAILSSLIRDLMAMGAGRNDTIANVELHDNLTKMAPAFDPPRLLTAFAAVRQAEASIDRNASPKIVADWLAVTL